MTVGETMINLTRDNLHFQTSAIVVPSLDCDILAGVPFIMENNIILDLPRGTFEINGFKIPLSNPSVSPSSASVRFCQSFPLRAPRNEIILPGQFLDAVLPEDLPPDTEVALEPR